MAKQYDSYVAIENAHVNGKLTLGENIADLGGLSVAYDGLMKALENDKEAAAKKIDGFTQQQRFFLSWAQIWRNNIRKENLLLRLKTDVHSPGKFRITGPLSNLPIFYKAFNVTSKDAMFKSAKELIKIW